MKIQSENSKSIRRSLSGAMAMLMAVMLIACMLSACGSSGATAAQAKATTELAAANNIQAMADADGYHYDMYEGQDEVDLDSQKKTDKKGNPTPSAYSKAEVKLIRRASLTLETKEFQSAITGLENLVKDMGGYVENSNLDQGNYWSANSATYREASYTVRIPSEKYDEFLSRASSEEHCHLSDKSESTEDVGQQYFDAETRLKTLRTKLDRLQELLGQAKKMNDIITLEQAITDTEYEIEQYTSTLNRYDSLVGYSVFDITVRQVIAISDADTTPYLTRLGNAFVGGFESFVDWAQDVTVWFAGHIFIMIVTGVITTIVFNAAVKRRKRKKVSFIIQNPHEKKGDKDE